MKKILPLLLCLLVLLQVPAFAEINKTISDDGISLEKTTEFHTSTDQLWISIDRSGTFKKLLGLHRVDTFHYLGVELAPIKNSENLSFSQKNLPFFSVLKDGTTKNYYFKTSSINKSRIDYSVDNAALKPLATAEKVAFIVPSKDGSIQKIDIPDDVLNDWKFIINCDLWQEYKKGV